MNKLESFVYNRVKNNYIVKNALRNLYQGFYDLLPNYPSRFSVNPIVRENSFFGFHDCCPFSMDGTKHLAYKLHIPLRMPGKDDLLEVGYWTGKDYEQWVRIGETGAWNYHKGSRLQWINGKECIYNNVVDGVLKSTIVDVHTGEKRVIDWAIDTVSPDGRLATTFSYERLQ